MCTNIRSIRPECDDPAVAGLAELVPDLAGLQVYFPRNTSVDLADAPLDLTDSARGMFRSILDPNAEGP